MELSLKDAVSIVDTIKTLDWYSVWIWLSITIPAYYTALRKVMPEKKEDEITPTDLDSKRWSLNWVIKKTRVLFTFPRIQPLLLYTCAVLFICGTIVMMVGQHEKERIRKIGWTLKNYMANQHFYRMSLKEVRRVTRIANDDLFRITNQYPNEYVVVYSDSIQTRATEIHLEQIADSATSQINSFIPLELDTTIVMVDSIRRKAILDFSEKQLAAYLSNNAYTSVNEF